MEASISSNDDDFSAEPRGRCYTWPMQQYIFDTGIPPPPHDVQMQQQQGPPPGMCREPTVAQLLAATPCSSAMGSHLMPLGMPMHGLAGIQMLPKKKRCRKKPADQLAQKKPNPWGEESYSDLIAKALESAPDGRLKLNEIYQWFSDNIHYFRERSSQEDAAGWKNSIRHNLSLHSRFMRIQNEGAGKSSWWVINPDAKPGRNPRRQRERSNTMDTASKTAISKSRRGARKKIQDIRLGLHSGMSSVTGSTASIMSHGVYEDDDSMQQPGYDNGMFRPRTQSNISMPSARVSPSMEHTFEDLDFPPWIENSVPTIPSDIVDRTDQIRIDSARAMNGIKIEQKPSPIMKFQNEPIVPQTYHELNSVRGPSQLQNPLLRNHPLKFGVPTFFRMPGIYPSYATTPAWSPTIHTSSPNQLHMTNQSCASSVSALPLDLENLTLPDQPLIEMDMESLLRHELSQTIDHRINFD